MRPIDRIILHCSATRTNQDIGAAEIRKWHTTPPRNWSDIGYHYVIRRDGTIEPGRPLDRAGAHTKGHNATSIGICYVGGIAGDGTPEDNMTAAQEMSWMLLVNSIRVLFRPDITVHGHNEYSTKACPSFDVQQKYGFLNHPEHQNPWNS